MEPVESFAYQEALRQISQPCLSHQDTVGRRHGCELIESSPGGHQVDKYHASVFEALRVLGIGPLIMTTRDHRLTKRT